MSEPRFTTPVLAREVPQTSGPRVLHGHPWHVRLWQRYVAWALEVEGSITWWATDDVGFRRRRIAFEIWQRGINPSGYGVASSNGRTRIAHRLMYEKAHGPVADDMELHHQCEVRACVNPNHLLPVTPAEHGRFSVKATKTHCINGHEFTPENTYHRPDAPHRRTCIACERERTRRLRAKRGRYA